MTDETTTEQLAEIEGQAEPIQVREGRWRTRGGEIRNVTPTSEGDGREQRFPWWDAQYRQTWTADGRYHFGGAIALDLVEYLGPIEQDKTQELPDKTQELPEDTPPEGRRVVRFGEQLLPGAVWVSHDGTEQRSNILQWDAAAVRGGHCIRRIEPQPQPQPQPQAATIEELRSEVSYVQRLLGESRQRVTQLEELVASLRTINVAQEKAFTAAGQDNTALQNQLAAVKAEVVQERLERNRWHNQVLRVTAELDEKTTRCEILQIELDAAQQVPADSPELRQLRADLAEVTQDRDTYKHAHELLMNDVNATHQRTKVMTIEAIVEWLVPIRTCGSQALATAVISNLPHIMRSLTGLEDEGIE